MRYFSSNQNLVARAVEMCLRVRWSSRAYYAAKPKTGSKNKAEEQWIKLNEDRERHESREGGTAETKNESAIQKVNA